MTTKRIMRWVIVLFLLAALPGLTAVMAQEQKTGNEFSEDTQPSCNINESENNNTIGTSDRIAMNDVVCGEIEWDDFMEGCIDNDVFRFIMPDNGYVLVDLLYTWSANYFCLRNGSGTALGCTPFIRWPGQAGDVLLLGLEAGTYYLDVENLGFSEACSTYAITVTRPLLVSAAAANLGTGNVADIPFQSNDILGYSHLNNGMENWAMVFDASDVGITKNVTNIAASSGDKLLLSLSANQTLPGVGVVTPWDIVVFDADQYGDETVGTFRMGLDGSAHQLTTSGEKLDAIDGWSNGYNRCYGYPVSTAGVATVTGWLGTMKQDDEDVFCKVHNGAWQPYDWFFDVNGKFDAPASEPAPGNVTGLAGEDVYAMAYNDTTETMYLTILGSGNIFGHRVTQKDIFAINYPGYTWSGVVWRGPDHGWNYNIDAVELNGW